MKRVSLVGIMLLLSCQDDKDDIVDPCPGWLAFKVGNEWTYKFIYSSIGCPPAPYDTCELVLSADSIVTSNDKHYLQLNFAGPKGYSGYFRIRCHGDTCWGLLPFSDDWFNDNFAAGEKIIWDLTMDDGDSIDYFKGDFPISARACHGKQKITFLNQDFEVTNFMFWWIPWYAGSLQIGQSIHKILGIYSYGEGNLEPIIWELKSTNFTIGE